MVESPGPESGEKSRPGPRRKSRLDADGRLAQVQELHEALFAEIERANAEEAARATSDHFALASVAFGENEPM